MEDDYYGLLNLSRNCTDDEVRAAYKRLCMYYHPDKHSNANRESAELVFQKIKRAYEVLIDPQMRTIYDIYGVHGIESGWHLALHDMDRNQIKDTYERMLRQKKEQEQARATNPISHISLQLDASGLCYSSRETYIADLLNIPTKSFTLAQSVDAPLTERNRATITCTAVNNEDYAAGTVQTSLRHTFSSTDWLESSFSFGQGALVSLRGYKSLTKFLFSSFRSQVARIEDEYISYSCSGILGCNIDDRTSLKVDVALDKTIRGVLTMAWDKLKIYTSYQIGLESHVLSLQLIRPLRIHSPGDAFLECSAKYDLVDGAHFEYGASKQLTDYSSLAAVVRVGQASGVKLKLLLTRGNHSYRFDIIFSDIIEPVAVLYGTFLPVFVYSALHWLVINPYLNKLKEEELHEKTSDMAAKIEKSRDEARAAIHLMKATYDKSINNEQCKRGLILEQAWFGVFGSSSKLIDVTIPLQVLVSNSKLILPEQSKAGMVGFYDVSFGEKKQLSVRYRFRNIIHEVIIDDSERLMIPKQSHKVS